MLRRGQRGAALVLFVLALAAMIGMGALVLDLGHLTVNKARLQSTVDAAALAAAFKLFETAGNISQATAAANAVVASNKADFPELNASSTSFSIQFSIAASPFTVTSTSTSSNPAKYARVIATNFSFTTALARVFGISSMNTAARAVAGPTSPVSGGTTAGNGAPEVYRVVPMFVCGSTSSGSGGESNRWGFDTDAVAWLRYFKLGSSTFSSTGSFRVLPSVTQTDFAGGYNGVLAGGQSVTLKTNALTQTDWNAIVNGLATRLNSGSSATFPSDVVTDQPSRCLLPNTSYDTVNIFNPTSGGTTCTSVNLGSGNPRLGTEVTTSNYTTQVSVTYDDYAAQLNNNSTASYDVAAGVPKRRLLAVPIIENSSSSCGSSSTATVLGFACMYLIQRPNILGMDITRTATPTHNFIMAELAPNQCVVGGTPDGAPDSGPGPVMIKLYDDVGSGDS